MKKGDTSIALKTKTKEDFDKKLISKMTSIYGKLSYDAAIQKLNEYADEIIKILN